MTDKLQEWGCYSCELVWKIEVKTVEDQPISCPDCGSPRIHQYIPCDLSLYRDLYRKSPY